MSKDQNPIAIPKSGQLPGSCCQAVAARPVVNIRERNTQFDYMFGREVRYLKRVFKDVLVVSLV
jgi:hypothetical protein